MIRIERGTLPPDIRVFTVKKSKAKNGTLMTRAELELSEAIDFFQRLENFKNNEKLTKANFAFRVYKNVQLAAALEQAFGNKCAYCESDFGHVTPKDIEHFRPKSEVTALNGVLRPGYYWLAGEWDNLLVSCPDCNRGRNFEVPGQPKKVKLGKVTQFPLAWESRRIRAPGGTLTREEASRLILDPCAEDPEEHLTFTDDGLIHPREDAQGKPSRKGEVSIAVYALQRKALVEHRLEVLTDFVLRVDALHLAIKNYNAFLDSGNTAMAEENRLQIVKSEGEIKGMLAPGMEYLGMLRDWIRRRKQAGDLADIENKAKLDLESFI